MTSEKNERILYPIIIIAVIILIILIIKIPRRSVETKFQLTELVQEVSNTPVSVFGKKFHSEGLSHLRNKRVLVKLVTKGFKSMIYLPSFDVEVWSS